MLYLQKDDSTVFKNAIQKFGNRNQLDMYAEECIELSNALAYLELYPRSKTAYNEVIGELADVILMTNQIKHLSDYSSDIKEAIDTKKYHHRINGLLENRRILMYYATSVAMYIRKVLHRPDKSDCSSKMFDFIAKLDTVLTTIKYNDKAGLIGDVDEVRKIYDYKVEKLRQKISLN